jgi:FkbM family methyltransferase
MDSWSLALFRQTRPYLTLQSFWQYRAFLCDKNQQAEGLLRLKMRAPISRPIYIRKGSSDPATFKEVFLQQVYRPVVENLKECRTVIDVGANIGLASLYLSIHYGRDIRCMGVEANPDTFRILKMNFEGSNARLLNAAAWDSETTLTAECRNQRFSTSTVSAGGDGNIPGLPMAEIIKRSGFDRVDLLKLDIEGAEVRVFRGDLSWLNSVRAVAIEFHDDSRELTSFDKVMQQYGFKIIDERHTTVAIRS